MCGRILLKQRGFKILIYSFIIIKPKVFGLKLISIERDEEKKRKRSPPLFSCCPAWDPAGVPVPRLSHLADEIEKKKTARIPIDFQTWVLMNNALRSFPCTVNDHPSPIFFVSAGFFFLPMYVFFLVGNTNSDITSTHKPGPLS